MICLARRAAGALDTTRGVNAAGRVHEYGPLPGAPYSRPRRRGSPSPTAGRMAPPAAVVGGKRCAAEALRQRCVACEEPTTIWLRWNSTAEGYSARVGHGSDPIYGRFRDSLWRHLGEDLTGLDVLDVGCGHGWLAELCRARGAVAVGVDGSDALLAIARDAPDVEFEHADVSAPLPRSITSRTFHRVIAHMVVMNIPSRLAGGRAHGLPGR